MSQHVLKLEVKIPFGPRDDMARPGVTPLTREQVLKMVGETLVELLVQHVPEESRCVIDAQAGLYKVVKPDTTIAGGKN